MGRPSKTETYEGILKKKDGTTVKAVVGWSKEANGFVLKNLNGKTISKSYPSIGSMRQDGIQFKRSLN